MTYDDWKLASPPEYEEDAPPAQPQAIHEEPAHRCASHECWACGECQVCREHKPFCDSVRQTMEVDPDVAF